MGPCEPEKERKNWWLRYACQVSLFFFSRMVWLSVIPSHSIVDEFWLAVLSAALLRFNNASMVGTWTNTLHSQLSWPEADFMRSEAQLGGHSRVCVQSDDPKCFQSNRPRRRKTWRVSNACGLQATVDQGCNCPLCLSLGFAHLFLLLGVFHVILVISLHIPPTRVH